MWQYYKSCLCVTLQWMIANEVMTEACYRALRSRHDIRVLRRGCRGVPALVDYESLPSRFKERITSILGDPYKAMRTNILRQYLHPSMEAAEFFEGFTFGGGQHLPEEVVRRYVANASILDAVRRYLTECKGRTGALGQKVTIAWPTIAKAVSELYGSRYPHSLPENHQGLARKLRDYEDKGYTALIHKAWGAGKTTSDTAGGIPERVGNAAKIRTQQQYQTLLTLAADPRNLSHTQVTELYNERAAAAGWPTIDARTVGRWRAQHEQEIFACLHGATRFRAERTMAVKRSAPSAPLYFWTLDGWDAELLYQKTTTDRKGHSVTTYHNRLKLEVVLDACTKYPIGFAIGDTESPALVREALRNAINHTRDLFGARFRPAQIQMDHAGYKSLEETYNLTAAKYVTPAAVKNAKAKIIEPWFRFFNDKYCHLQTNWSGYGLTASKDSQPNTEYINRYRHDFPDRAGVVRQLTQFINAERARLHDEYVQKWEAMPEENRFPMSDEQFLLAYGVRSQRTYLLRGTGIKLTLPSTDGRTVDFDCFDHDFRRHASVRWTVIYDPEDTRHALAVNADGSLRFALEEKHVQPMALIERTEGDAEQLERVREFNRQEEQRISRQLGKMGEGDPLRIGTAELDTNNIATRDFETLSKLLIVDSDGQHKQQKDKARIESQTPTPAEEEEPDIFSRY